MDTERITRLRDLTEALCAPATAGRKPGTPEGVAARNLVVEALSSAGAHPAGTDGYLQPIPAVDGANVLAALPGGARAQRWVILAAHYDHLGGFPGGAFWGADDNAAGVAVMVDVARRLCAEGGLERSVVFASFDAEEPPFFLGPDMGSNWWVANPTIPLDAVDLMVCLDLVGHAIGGGGLPAEVRDTVFVLGAERSAGTAALVDAASVGAEGVTPRRVDNWLIPPLSDYYAFEQAGIPFLFYSCGRWEHYHQPTDTPDRLDYPKMAALAEHLADMVRAAANRPEERVEYLPDGTDDAATLASLTGLLEPLAGLSPLAEAALGTLRELASAGRPLTETERATVAGLATAAEAALA